MRPPFHLHTFPGLTKCEQLREDENPVPTLFLGYESKEKKQEKHYLESHWRKM